MVRRGTEYGGWWFEASDDLRQGLVVSAGAGEDISFDCAVAREFDADVILIDPTPRAISHVDAVLARTGQQSECSLVAGGNQPPAAYNVSGVRPGQMTLLPYALWNEDTELTFHPTIDPAHVSYTIGDWRRSPEDTRPSSLRVAARHLTSLLTTAQTEQIAILKLDIEEAEIEALEDILAAGILPRQILVEFDQLADPNRAHRVRARQALRILRNAGYRLTRRERLNFSFALIV